MTRYAVTDWVSRVKQVCGREAGSTNRVDTGDDGWADDRGGRAGSSRSTLAMALILRDRCVAFFLRWSRRAF